VDFTKNTTNEDAIAQFFTLIVILDRRDWRTISLSAYYSATSATKQNHVEALIHHMVLDRAFAQPSRRHLAAYFGVLFRHDERDG
jgi:hypothetical protein